MNAFLYNGDPWDYVDGKPKEGGGSPTTTSIAVGKRTMVNTDALIEADRTRSVWTYQSFLRSGSVYLTENGFKTIRRATSQARPRVP